MPAFILFSRTRGKPFFPEHPRADSRLAGTKMANEQRRRASVKLYTRPGCHLCFEAKREMSAAACEDLYVIEEINIDTDPELRRRYGWDIPVITINGTLAFKHRLTSEDFREEVRRAVES